MAPQLIRVQMFNDDVSVYSLYPTATPLQKMIAQIFSSHPHNT
jgi:hypothetical protein